MDSPEVALWKLLDDLRLLKPWVDHELVIGDDQCTDRCPACLLCQMLVRNGRHSG